MRLAVLISLLCLSAPAFAEECVLEFRRDEVEIVRGELRVDLGPKVRRECRRRGVRVDRIQVVLKDRVDPGRPSGRGLVPIYRFFSGRQHMVSDSPDEGPARGFQQNEGVLFSLYPRGGPKREALYACSVPSQNDQFLSRRADCEGQRVERLLGYIAVEPEGRAQRPLYRCYLGKARDHLHTTDKEECTRNGYAVEPILGYVP